MSHYKALLHVIKYVINTNDYCYQMKPYRNLNGLWELRGYSDSDNSGDNNTQKIVTVYIIIINRLVIAWHSQINKKLHYLLQNLNIQQQRRYVRKYYVYVQFIVCESYC